MSNKGLNALILDTINEISDGKYMFVHDMENGSVRWTKAAKEYFGLQDVYLNNFSEIWYDMIHPDEVEKCRKELEEVLSQKKDTFFMLYHMKNAKGNYVLCRGKGRILRDDEGNAIVFAGAVTLCTGELSYDGVSGLQTANGFAKAIQRYKDEGQEYLTLIIEILNFSTVNTLYSYNFGSKVIYELATRFHDMVEGIGHVYRNEGTQFIFLVKDVDVDYIKDLYEQIIDLCAHFTLDGNVLNLEIVGGMLCAQEWSKDPHDVLSCLVSIIEKAKTEEIYDLIVYDDELHTKMYESTQLINTIKSAITNNCEGFFLCYQPFVSTISGRVIGAEALIRWRSEEFGLVSPFRFIPYIESHPCFYDLGLWILRQAVTDAKEISKKQPNFFINVNMSYSQLEHPGFKEEVVKILEEIGFPNQCLQLEITERCRNLDMRFLKEQLDFFKEHNIKIALDDYGTGTSTIDMLCDLPIDCVKIDQTFILNILKQSNNQVIVDTTLQCTKRLGIDVCLEGVENQEIKDFVGKYSANYHQGYYYSRPVEYDEFVKFLNQTWETDNINILYGNDKGGMDVNNILSIFPGAFFIYRNDPSEKIICANEELLRMFECDTEEEFKELTGNSFKGIVHPDDYERVENSINRQIANSVNNNFDSVDYRIRTKKGNEFIVHDYGHLVKNEYNEEVYYVFLAKDIKA